MWYEETQQELEEVRQLIELHKQQLTQLRERRKKLERKLFNGTTGVLRGNDSLFVEAAELRPYVKEWVSVYNGEHGGKGGVLTLSLRSKVSGRIIRKIKNGDVTDYGKNVTLATVERLLDAMGLEHILDDLHVYPMSATRAPVPEPPPSHYWED